MKKVLAFLLAFTLLLVPFGTLSFAATTEYADVTLIGTAAWDTSFNSDRNCWNLYLSTSGHSGTAWVDEYESITFEYNGNTYTSLEVKSAGEDIFYCAIPGDVVPNENGANFTIKAGQYAPVSAETTVGINITNDLEVVVVDGKLIHTQVVYADNVYIDPNGSNANALYFNLADASGNPIPAGLGSWSYFLSPGNCYGTRTEESGWATTYSGVFVDDIAPVYWGEGRNVDFKNTADGAFYIGGLNAVAGTTVVVRGYFVSTSQADWANIAGGFFLKEITFTFDGTNWSFVRSDYEYRNVGFTGVKSWESSFDGNNWVFYLKTDAFVGVNWDYKYEGFNYEYNGNIYTTTQVSSVGADAVYFTIPSSVVPGDSGAIITIKKGQYKPDKKGIRYGLNITSDFEVVTVDGHIIDTTILDNGNVTVDSNTSTANVLYFNLADANGIPLSTGVESWDRFLSPSTSEYIRMEASGWATTYTGVFVDDNTPDYWTENQNVQFKNIGNGAFYIGKLNAVAGTTVVVRGHFTSSNGGDWSIAGHMYFKEIKFTYDGSAWYVGDGPEYTEYTGTPVFQPANDFAGLYFSAGETEFPYNSDVWNVAATPIDNDESGVFLNGEKTAVVIKKIAEDKWYVCLADAGVVPDFGDEITIAGTFVYGTHKITFEEATYVYENPTETFTGTPVLSESGGFGSAAGFYFTSNDGASYDSSWGTPISAAIDANSGVFVNGVKTGVVLKKINANTWYVDIAGVALNYGDLVTIKGSFVNGDEIINFNEAVFKFDGKRFGVGDFEVTDFTVTGLSYNHIIYDEERGCWIMYFTLSNNIPGECDRVTYPYLTYSINGVDYTTDWFKSAIATNVNGEDVYNLCILMDKLPKDFNGEYVVTLKAGAVQGLNSTGRTPCDFGIRLTEDYQFTVGASYNASAPSVDYLTGNGGNANGIYLTVNDDFPVTGWDYKVTKSGENSGVYVNGVNTDVFLKKYDLNKYYVGLSDMGITAQEGTIVLLKGTFTIKDLNTVTFQTAKYIFTDGQWKVYSATEDTGSTNVSGDSNGDNKTNVADLIRLKKYIAGATDKINFTDADLNGDGFVDSDDVVLTRKLLLGLIKFENGANITGVPTYNSDAEMRLSAYVSPTLSEGFDDYKAAGFTTLIGENRAMYGDANLDAYMNLAAQKGLDVIVQAGAMQLMLTGKEEYDAATLQTIYNDLSKYDNFRGWFMGDEPRISDLTTYTKVTNALKTLNPNLDFFTSCLPTYTNESFLSLDNSLSLNEKYTNYANSFGNLFGEFTYDFYPFKHSYKTFLGSKYNEKDYMRSDWFLNLTLAASNAKGAYDTGITVQSYADELNGKDYYREVTTADVSFQVYSALAYGMKSINYFTYGQHWDDSVAATSSMIYNGEKTAVYYAVQSVNNEIKAFDNVILDFNWQGTVGIKHSNGNGIMNYVEAYNSKRIDAYSATDDAIIGCLKDSNGYDGFMLVNATDPSKNVTENISVTFNNADHAKVFVNGVESIVELNNGTYEAALAPGQGIFVIPYIA